MKIKLISLSLVLVLLLCGCSRFSLPDTSQDEPFTSYPNEKNSTLTFSDLSENFYAEYIYSDVKFTVNRHGNKILKENQYGNYVLYEKNGENWECRYYENGEWQDVAYVENEAATIKKVLYFIATENNALSQGEKTGKTENICGYDTEEYYYEDSEGSVSCYYSPSAKMTLKETNESGNENRVLVWKNEAVDFSFAIP